MEIVLIVAFVIIVVTIVIATVIENEQKRQEEARKLAVAHKAYRDNLARLGNDPNNASLRKETLEFGRIYSNLTRKQSGVTIFDEIALKNDIDAACAGAVTMGQSTAQAERQTAKERIANLEELLQTRMISDSEYNERRERILDSI